MRWLQLVLMYDGTRYAGWQVQPGQATVQQVLEDALQQVTGAPARASASGRTDAGVHALGQVVSVCTETRLSCAVLGRALNAVLPNDIAVRSVRPTRSGFHARRDALGKRYRYQIDNGPVPHVFRRQFAWHVPTALDHEAMARAARGLCGRHDFRSFESSGSARQTSVRTVTDLCVRRGHDDDSNQVTIEVAADGFLYNMVRTIVGTLVEVGRGAQPEGWPVAVLRARDRRRAGPTAPPHGLCLLHVAYPADCLLAADQQAALNEPK
jgi:tRNA pseudouridine38-40 synthase